MTVSVDQIHGQVKPKSRRVRAKARHARRRAATRFKPAAWGLDRRGRKGVSVRGDVRLQLKGFPWQT